MYEYSNSLSMVTPLFWREWLYHPRKTSPANTTLYPLNFCDSCTGTTGVTGLMHGHHVQGSWDTCTSIGNVELMHVCFPEKIMGTARI